MNALRPLPEDLKTVPAPGEDEHGDWQHRWEQHITRRLWQRQAGTAGHASGPGLLVEVRARRS
ncbi:hypothetical protein ACWFRT_21485 [Streptomyces anulatus]